MKSLNLVLLTILSVSVTLLSCKKSSSGTPQHVFTSSKTVTETITANATITKNGSGTWVVSGSTSASPIIDSLQMSGSVSFQIFDGGTYKYTLTANDVVGSSFSDPLNGLTFTSPTLQQVYYMPSNTVSTGSIDYTVNYQ